VGRRAESGEAALRETAFAASGSEDRSLSERCFNHGDLFLPNLFDNNQHHIVRTRGYVAILTEGIQRFASFPSARVRTSARASASG
jgi:hypothetical protein